jgi:carboxymethylenebutenolidase
MQEGCVSRKGGSWFLKYRDNVADMAKLQPLMASINAPGAAERDAVAYIAFLDGQSQVNKAKKIGTQGHN